MPFETEADLAGFFDPDDFAVEATYRAKVGGVALTVAVNFDEPDDDGSVGEIGVVSTAVSAQVPAFVFGSKPARGDTLTLHNETRLTKALGTKTFEIRQARALEAGAVYVLSLVPAVG